jgi:hypothetical protein
MINRLRLSNALNEFKDNFRCGNLVNINEVYTILGKGINNISNVEIFVLGDSLGKIYLMSNEYEEIYLYENDVKSVKEYLGIYDLPYVEYDCYKIYANDWEGAFNKFIDKLLEEEVITRHDYDTYKENNYSDGYIKIIPLFEVERI